MSTSARERSRARRAAVQALYQWQLTGQTPADIGAQFSATPQLRKCDTEYFHDLLSRVPSCVDDLDAYLAPVIDRPIAQLDPVERAILRIGVFELVHRVDVPAKVVINEAVELAKTFGAEESHKYINGVLHTLAGTTRFANETREAPLSE